MREVHSEFAQSQYGEILSRKIRFDRYKLPEIDNQNWEKLLGKCDINNLDHILFTYGIANLFVRNCDFNEDEKELILLAAIIHDHGEAINDDINYDFKTENDEKEEKDVLKKITEELYGKHGDKLAEKINIAIDEIIFDPESKLGEAFNMVERIGYMRTAVKAWKRSKSVGMDSALKSNLQWLAENVSSNQIPKLIENSKKYPMIDWQLNSWEENISEIFNETPNNTFDKYDTKEEKEKRKLMFDEAKMAWEKRKKAI